MIAYPETGQFRAVIASVKRHATVHDPTQSKELPVMKFIGTVKLHGSNGALAYRKGDGHWCQSRNNILTPTKDNAGFAQYLDPIADRFFAEQVLPQSPVIRDYYDQGRIILIYGEWCGGNIQKNVAITGLTKMFVIFKVRIVDPTATNVEGEGEGEGEEENQDSGRSKFWIDPKDWSHLKWHEQHIYNIYDFPTYEVEIDFNKPELIQNKLVEITNEVERQCPVGHYFNKIGIGEGVVWTEWIQTQGHLTFKVKGAEHSVSKVTKLAPVDTEKIANIDAFIDYACTENRMSQGLDYLREQQLTIEMKNIPTFLRWVVNDILKEEKDTMEKSSIDQKDLTRAVSCKARIWYQNHLSE